MQCAYKGERVHEGQVGVHLYKYLYTFLYVKCHRQEIDLDPKMFNLKCTYSFPLEEEFPGKEILCEHVVFIGVTRALRFPMVIIKGFTKCLFFSL